MDHPKDYADNDPWVVDQEDVEEKFNYAWQKAFDQAWEDASPLEKLVWHLANHPVITTIVSLITGYLAGTYFGTFW